MKRLVLLITAPLLAQVDAPMSQYDIGRTATTRQERTLHPSNVTPHSSAISSAARWTTANPRNR